MKANNKVLILGAGIGLTALAFFGKKKYLEAVSVINNLEFSIRNISNIRLSLQNIKFDGTLKIINPTNINFGATTASIVKLKEVRAFAVRSGVFLGKANTELFAVDLPASSTVDIPNIPFHFDLIPVLQELGTNYQTILQNPMEYIFFEVDLQAFGNVITIEI